MSSEVGIFCAQSKQSASTVVRGPGHHNETGQHPAPCGRLVRKTVMVFFSDIVDSTWLGDLSRMHRGTHPEVVEPQVPTYAGGAGPCTAGTLPRRPAYGMPGARAPSIRAPERADPRRFACGQTRGPSSSRPGTPPRRPVNGFRRAHSSYWKHCSFSAESKAAMVPVDRLQAVLLPTERPRGAPGGRLRDNTPLVGRLMEARPISRASSGQARRRPTEALREIEVLQIDRGELRPRLPAGSATARPSIPSVPDHGARAAPRRAGSSSTPRYPGSRRRRSLRLQPADHTAVDCPGRASRGRRRTLPPRRSRRPSR